MLHLVGEEDREPDVHQPAPAARCPVAPGRRSAAGARTPRRSATPRACGSTPATRSTPSAAIDVIVTSGSPQATTQLNGSRSLSTLTAKPCDETPCEMCTPTDAILCSPTHTPTCLWPSLCRLDTRVGQRGHERLLHREDVLRHAGDPHDRVADELARPVVGELAAARRAHHVDPALPVEALGERQVGRLGPARDGVDRRVLEQQHQLGQLTRDHLLAQPLLQRRRLAVFDAAQVADRAARRPSLRG